MQKYSRQNSIRRKNNYIFNDLANIKRPSKCCNKSIKLIFIFLFIIILFTKTAFNSSFVLAKENKKSEEEIKIELGEEINKLLEKIDFTDLDNFISSIDSNIGKLFDYNFRGLVEKIISGEFIVDFNSFLNYVINFTKSIFTRYIPIIIFIVFIAILSGILNGLTSGFIKKQTTDLINLVCYFSIIIVVFVSLSSVVNDVKYSVLGIKKLMDITFPIMLTLIFTMGGVTTNTMYKPLMLVLSNFIVQIIVNIIIPIFIASIILSVVGNMSSTIKLTKLPNFLVTFSSWLLGIVFSLFSAFITVKGISGIMVDNVSISATKFCLSSYVPVLGGYVSDGFDLVLASCMLIKNSFGVTVLVLLILITILPVIKVLFFMLSLRLIEAIIEPVCDSKICKLLNSISKSLVMLISALIGLSFMFFILMFLIISTFNFSY